MYIYIFIILYGGDSRICLCTGSRVNTNYEQIASWDRCQFRIALRAPVSQRHLLPPIAVASMPTTWPWLSHQKWIGTSWAASHAGHNSESILTLTSSRSSLEGNVVVTAVLSVYWCWTSARQFLRWPPGSMWGFPENKDQCWLSISDYHHWLIFTLIRVFAMCMGWLWLLWSMWQNQQVECSLCLRHTSPNKACHDDVMLSALLALCEGNPLVTSGFPSQRDRDVDHWFFFYVRLNMLLNKQLICN